MTNQDQNTYAPLDPQSAQVVQDQLWLHKAPSQYRDIIEQQAKANKIPISTAVKMLSIESGFNPHLVSKSGALGIAQVLPSTGAQMGYSPQQLMNPETGIEAGISYLGQMYHKYGSEDSALAAYNMGPGNMDKVLAGKMQIPNESAAYINKAHSIGLDNSQIQYNNGIGNTSDTKSNLNSNINAMGSYPTFSQSSSRVEEEPESGGILNLAKNFTESSALNRKSLLDAIGE